MKLVIRIMVVIITLVFATMFYTSKFDVTLDEDVLVEKLAELMIAKLPDQAIGKVNIIKTEPFFEDYLIRFEFELEDIHQMAMAHITEGLNKKYTIIRVNHLPSHDDLGFMDLSFKGEHFIGVFGFAKEIGTIRLNGNTTNDIGELPSVGEVVFPIKTEVFADSVTSYDFLDLKGNLTSYKVSNPYNSLIDHRGTIVGADALIVMAGTGLILIIGFIFSFMFTPELNMLERLYMKVTKSNFEVDYDEEFKGYI